MRKRLTGALVLAASALALFAAAPASAATKVGNTCSSTASIGSVVAFSMANGAGNPMPAVIPENGVITEWTFSTAQPIPPGLLTETLKVFRATGAPKQVKVVAESAPESTLFGLNTFQARLPVQAGDRLGALAVSLEGGSGFLYCPTGNPGDVVGAVAGPAPLNSTLNIEEQAPGIQLPIIATVEPDVDNDGFGDETQDKCPQSAAVQAECPVVTVEATSVIKEKKAVVVLVTSSFPAPVKVTGQVNLGKGKKAKLGAKPKTVAPGSVTRFKLAFTKALKKKLAKLPTTKTLPLKITVSATDSIGRVTTDTAKAPLKGQAKAKKKRAGRK